MTHTEQATIDRERAEARQQERARLLKMLIEYLDRPADERPIDPIAYALALLQSDY